VLGSAATGSVLGNALAQHDRRTGRVYPDGDLSVLAGARMSQSLPKPWTVEDFLAWERRQAERYEFVGGVIRMMVGGSNTHTIMPSAR
jgi:hypothetical protein